MLEKLQGNTLPDIVNAIQKKLPQDVKLVCDGNANEIHDGQLLTQTTYFYLKGTK